ncbi:MAG TPA: diaminopimelate decarboxylase [Terriglobales bacterium]|jgi:diaminopimelate decarboxylase|nr:diaminopimelate decarboxylase [Terriglobales bacterium]
MPETSNLIVRPPAFVYRKASKTMQLHCEKEPLAKVAARFGTPAYVYSAQTLHSRFEALDKAFKNADHTICYSVKANSNLTLLRLLHKLGSGFDVVSGGELERVLRVGKRAAQNTVFSGVGKTADEMDAALRAGILMFNLESESEMRLLAGRAGRAKKKAPVAFRVNPDVVAETHPYISTGLREHKFGVPMAEALRLYSAAAEQRWLDVRGISVHIGSQITSVQPFAAALGRVADLARELLGRGHKIRYIDAGGGLGIPYNHGQEDLSATANAYAQSLLRSLHDLDVHLLLEPGRSIVGPAGVLLTRVLYLKRNGEKRFAVVDAAMNDLLRPSLYNAYHQIVPVERRDDDGLAKTDIVGPICETGDFFARDREMPALQEGDLLAILDTGAYGMSLASNYNSRPRPVELLVDGKKVKVVRKKESVKDLLALEV